MTGNPITLKHMRELMKKQKFFQAMKRRSAGNWKFIKTYGRIWKALQLILSTYIPVPVEEESRLEIISDFYSQE